MNLELSTGTFDEFWSIYPRKTGGKDKAREKFNKLSEVDRFNAIQGAKHHSEHNEQWKNPSFIPHATTYLNQKRWQDDIVEDKPATARVQDNGQQSQAHTVWSAMTQMYGTAWINKHGENPSPVWVSQLKHMGDDRIKRGLRRTLESKSEFAPSLPKFVEYCALTFGEECQINQPQLPKPECNPEKAIEAIEEMKRILNCR